jgi:hypothetical protein
MTPASSIGVSLLCTWTEVPSELRKALLAPSRTAYTSLPAGVDKE